MRSVHVCHMLTPTARRRAALTHRLRTVTIRAHASYARGSMFESYSVDQKSLSYRDYTHSLHTNAVITTIYTQCAPEVLGLTF